MTKKSSSLLPGTHHVHFKFDPFDVPDGVDVDDPREDVLEWLQENGDGRVDMFWHERDLLSYYHEYTVVDGTVYTNRLPSSFDDDDEYNLLTSLAEDEAMTILFAFESKTAALRFAVEFTKYVL